MSFSELADYMRCPYAFRLRHRLGFQPRIAPELGYGKSVHHALRTVADEFQSSGRLPTDAELNDLLDREFFLPYASKPAHLQLKGAAKRLVTRYLDDHSDDLDRIWEAERPFELHLNEAVVTGRADRILDREGGHIEALAIVDYKTSTGRDDDYDLQLQVYADAGRREGLDVRAAYIHDLDAADRIPIDISSEAVVKAEERVRETLTRFTTTSRLDARRAAAANATWSRSAGSRRRSEAFNCGRARGIAEIWGSDKGRHRPSPRSWTSWT